MIVSKATAFHRELCGAAMSLEDHFGDCTTGLHRVLSLSQLCELAGERVSIYLGDRLNAQLCQ